VAQLPISATLTRQVVVVGAGVAGVYAALGAARSGAQVLLIEQHGFVGGQGTAGGVHTFCGDTQNVNDAWLQMLARLEEFDGGVDPYRPDVDGRRFNGESLKYVLQEMLLEAGVELLLHTTLVGVERCSDSVTALVVSNKSGLARVRPGAVVDASGDADVIALGGWPFDKGGPGFRPEGDHVALLPAEQRLQLPMSLYFGLVDTGREAAAYLPPGCPSWPDDADLPMTSVYQEDGYLLVKMKVIGFDATEGVALSNVEHAARRQMLGLVYYLQTRGYRGRRYPRHRLAWVAPHIGVREGRRVSARRPMRLPDLLTGAEFPDAVAVGSYHLDYHWPTDHRRAGTGLSAQVPPYQIPLGAMLPIGTSNVLVPGRCLGGEQIAMSSYRVMGICAQTGFAAGVVAAKAIQLGTAAHLLEPSTVRAAVRRHGVRLDRAPYLNYLRSRRVTRERIAAMPGREVGALALALLPDSQVVCVWAAVSDDRTRSVVYSVRRVGETWLPATEVRSLPGQVDRIELWTADEHRIFGELREVMSQPAKRVDEQDGTVHLYLNISASDQPRAYLESTDHGQTWHADSDPSLTPHRGASPVPGLAEQAEPAVVLATEELVPYPGDRGYDGGPVLVALVADAGRLRLISSLDGGRAWSPTMELSDRLVVPAAGVVRTPVGASVAYVEPGAFWYLSLSYPTLVGQEPPGEMIHDERHSDLDWLELLAGAD
jgi:FAD-dependent oxidoreductase family protein